MSWLFAYCLGMVFCRFSVEYGFAFGSIRIWIHWRIYLFLGLVAVALDILCASPQHTHRL